MSLKPLSIIFNFLVKMSAQTGPLDVEERSEELLRQLSYATKNIRELAEQHHENISTL